VKKYKKKKITSYNEVADELVAEFQRMQTDQLATPIDQKNIRRRVYDALNVLMAMGIITKDKKMIKWNGLPNTKDNKLEIEELELEKMQRTERVKKKNEHLQELIMQYEGQKNLITRNLEIEVAHANSQKITLPFIMIQTKKHTQIVCEMAEDGSEYFFNFDLPFEIHDDITILAAMQLANSSSVQTTELPTISTPTTTERK